MRPREPSLGGVDLLTEEKIASSKLSLLLEENVGSEGGVDYGSLGKDGTVEKYVKWLAGFDRDSLNDQDERLAFWINSYNTLTLAGVLRELARNRDFAEKGNRSRINRVKFFWRRKYKIGGKDYNLYQIENAILRKEFSEPRIHFALNCGSASCPILRGGLYSGETLNEELDVAATIFVRSPRDPGWAERERSSTSSRSSNGTRRISRRTPRVFWTSRRVI